MRDTVHSRYFDQQAQCLGYADHIEAIRTLYAAGASYATICRLVGPTEMTLHRRMKRLGITPRPRGGCHVPQLIITYQGRTWTTSELARHFGTYRERVYAWLRRGKLPGARFEKRIAI